MSGVVFMDDPSYDSFGAYPRIAGATYSASGGRFYGPCWHGTVNWGGSAPTLATPLVTGTLAVSIYLTSYGASPTGFIRVVDTSTTQCDVRYDAAGHVYVTRNGTTIGSLSTNALSLNAWHRIEFQVTINSSSGSIEVRVDGTNAGWVPPTSGLNTQATANARFNQISLFGGASNSFNDLVLTDSSAGGGFLGDKRCFLLQPSANSSVTWTPNGAGSNYLCVDEAPPDGDTTYNSSATPGQTDLFSEPSLPGGAANIVAVDVLVLARKDDAGTRTIHGAMKSGSTQAETADFPLSTSYQYLDLLENTDPQTGVAWTVAGVNALLVGYKEIA